MAAQWCAIGARVRLCGGGLGARLRSMSIQLGSNVRVWVAVPSGGLIPMLSNAAKAIDGRARCGDCIRSLWLVRPAFFHKKEHLTIIGNHRKAWEINVFLRFLC